MGKIILFTINSELESAKKLGFNTQLSPRIPIENFKNDVCIRWGLGGPSLNRFYGAGEFKQVVNPGTRISLNCHKLKALVTLGSVVNTPKIYQTKVPAKKLIVRRPVNHSGGSDFAVCKGPAILRRGAEYATDYIKTDKEFRVYYCANNGGQFLLCRRITYSPTRLKEKFPCRSKWGYRFYKSVPTGLKSQVKAAFVAMGLEFGGADILYKNGKYYFCEINSAVTIDMDIIRKFFQRNLKKLVKQKFPKFKETNAAPKEMIQFERLKAIFVSPTPRFKPVASIFNH
jgi:hypothetical protein